MLFATVWNTATLKLNMQGDISISKVDRWFFPFMKAYRYKARLQQKISNYMSQFVWLPHCWKMSTCIQFATVWNTDIQNSIWKVTFLSQTRQLVPVLTNMEGSSQCAMGSLAQPLCNFKTKP